MLLYPLFPFSGDACRRTPRTPWPSSEYHILPDSCQPSTGGNIFMERASTLISSKAWVERDSQQCIFVHGFVHLCLCVWKGWWLFYLGNYFWTPDIVCVSSCIWFTGLTVVGIPFRNTWGYIMCCIFSVMSVCVCDLRAFLVPQDCRVPQVSQEILVQGWVKFHLISQLIPDVQKVSGPFSPYHRNESVAAWYHDLSRPITWSLDCNDTKYE